MNHPNCSAPWFFLLICLLLITLATARAGAADNDGASELGGIQPVSGSGSGRSADDRVLPDDDYLLPSPGRFTLTLSTGLPYVALAELSIGITDGLSLGATVALTPDNNLAIGGRLRAVLYEDAGTRLLLRMPVLFYPEVRGIEEWILARPALYVETGLSDTVRFSGGLGLMFAACWDSLPALFDTGESHDDTHESHGDTHESPGPEPFMGGLWYTVQVGASFDVDQHLTLTVDGMVIMNGFQLASDWPGIPFAILLGGTYRF